MAFDPTQSYGIIQDTAPVLWIQSGTIYNSATLATVTDISSYQFSGTPASPLSATTVAVTPSANQNDYAPGLVASWNILKMNIGATMKLTGLAGGTDGKVVTVVNTSTDYLLWLEHQSTASAAGNRFILPGTFPAWLMPGDFLQLFYDVSASRWRVIGSVPSQTMIGCNVFSDFEAGNNPWGVSQSGTGAQASGGNQGADSTNKAVGVLEVICGTTTTGRCSLLAASNGGPGSIMPTGGPQFFISRWTVSAVPDGTDTYSVVLGFTDSAAGTVTDAIVWEYRWTGSAVEFDQSRFAATVATRSTTNSPTVTALTYLWSGIFVNANGTRADYIKSTDSASFSVASSQTTGLPSATQIYNVGCSIIKSAGTTSRTLYLDLMGNREDMVRA